MSEGSKEFLRTLVESTQELGPIEMIDRHRQAIEDVLQPQGVGVVIEAVHLCMMMRGVEKQNSKTITSAVRGLFRRDHRTREEFLRLAHAPDTL